jgi:hypothetical protein
MPYAVETWSPAHRGPREVTFDELVALYRPEGDPVFTYADPGDPSGGDRLIVSLDEDFSTVTLLLALARGDRAPSHDGGHHARARSPQGAPGNVDDTFSWLVESSDEEEVEILLCGQEAWIPAGAKVSPATGLAALRLAADLPRLLTEFMWRPQ